MGKGCAARVDPIHGDSVCLPSPASALLSASRGLAVSRMARPVRGVSTTRATMPEPLSARVVRLELRKLAGWVTVVLSCEQRENRSYMEPETYYAKSGDLRIAYQVIGGGPDLVMVPGMTSHLEIQWRDPGYRRFVRSLSSFCRLVRFDKRGTGLSDPVAEPPTLDQRVADLMAVIAAARCRRPIVLGFSDGGPIAITLAADHRRSVRALILYGTSPRNPPIWAMRQLRAMARHWGQGDSLGIFAPTLAGELARRDRAAFERASASPAMVRALVESLTSIDVRSRLAEVDVPALVVHRRSDILPLSHAKAMAGDIRGARLVELEGSDHLPWVGDADSVLSAIAEFVTEVSGYRGGRTTTACGARRRRPATGWEALTDAERRVAHLVAGGLANREVADRLFLSRYTVETHLKHVFAKLGVSSRAELAALAPKNT
jgi:pimeloyl-ACP methyl ester carboxylesterase/DNA-binding CsgD family transcriptional regulator